MPANKRCKIYYIILYRLLCKVGKRNKIPWRKKRLPTHMLAWRRSRKEGTSRPQSRGLQIVGHKWIRAHNIEKVISLRIYFRNNHWEPPRSSPSRIQGNPQDERRRWMRERDRQSWGLSLKFIFARPLYTLNNMLWGEVHITYRQVISKHYTNLTFNRNRMSPTCFSLTGVFLIIWPSGLLTFYGLHLVWLKQLQ